MSGERVDDLRAIRLFENKTGRSVYTMDDVAKWIEDNHVMPMPEPATPRQLLAQRLSRSAGTAHRSDPDSRVNYRAYHAVRTERNGQFVYDWSDLDGPGATPERLSDSTQQRREQALGIGIAVRADWGRFYRIHPELERKMPDFDLNWEIDLRLGKDDENKKDDESEGENKKAV